jgi:hypothetical protein
MNDYMEQNWLLEKARRAIRSQLGSFECGKKRIKRARRAFDSKLDRMLLEEPPILTFAACFSTNGDLLSQWRAYAGNGGGFCIGLRTEALQELLPTMGSTGRRTTVDNIGLFLVEYDEASQERRIAQLITKHRGQVGESARPTEAASACYEAILQAALTCKNPAFSEEMEWRCIYVPQNDGVAGTAFARLNGPKFRCRGEQIVPYYELPLADPGKFPIAEIVFGPKNRDNGNLDAVKRLLVANGFDASKIKCHFSKATYR